MSRVHRQVKQVAERMLAPIGVAALQRPRRAPGRLVLAYHNVVTDAAAALGDTSLHLPVAHFLEQLVLLERHACVVPLVQLLSDSCDDGRASGRLRVAITFDDAYAGAVELAGAELARRGLPATIFVAPGLLDGARFWWDRLAGPAGAGLDPAVRTHALGPLQGKAPAVLAWAERAGLTPRDVPAIAAGASLESLHAALERHPGLTLGAHTWDHPNLAALDGAELEHELVDPLAWLRTRFGERVVPVVAYPYGLHSPAVEAAARAAGYTAGLAVAGGRIRRGHDGFTLPRFNVPAGLSDEGFLLRLAGLVAA